MEDRLVVRNMSVAVGTIALLAIGLLIVSSIIGG